MPGPNLAQGGVGFELTLSQAWAHVISVAGKEGLRGGTRQWGQVKGWVRTKRVEAASGKVPVQELTMKAQIEEVHGRPVDRQSCTEEGQ